MCFNNCELPQSFEPHQYTIGEYLKCTKDSTIPDAYIIKNKKCKLSIIYGAKILLLTKDIYEQLKLYIKHVRPQFTSDTHRLARERFVLFSSRSEDKVVTKWEPMNHSMVAQCLTRSFAKAEVLQGKNSFTRVSCSKLRFSIITGLIWGQKN